MGDETVRDMRGRCALVALSLLQLGLLVRVALCEMNMERIIAAAVQCEGFVYSLPPPARHGTILQHWPDRLSPDARRRSPLGATPIVVARGVQGFITDADRFVDRIEAAAIAIAAGQVSALRSPPNLYSEDLW